MTSRAKQGLNFFTEASIDIEKLICEVQDRPALWDMSKKDYSDRIKRKQCWDEIIDIFSFGKVMTSEDKQKLGDVLHKKWKNVRDRFTRDVQERKGKTGDAARKKAPYMYSHQLEFLRDTVTPKKTVSSLGHNISLSNYEEREEELHEDDEEDDEHQEAVSASSTRSSASSGSQIQVGKKRLHPVEEKILRSLERHEKRAKMDQEKERAEDNDNRHFLLSLLPSLASLPRQLNTSCRIEIMQCIGKYEAMSQQQQHQPVIYDHSYPSHSQHNAPPYQHQSQQYPRHTQMYCSNRPSTSTSPLLPTSSQMLSGSQQYQSQQFPRHTQLYGPNQLLLQSQSQQNPRSTASPASPAESVGSHTEHDTLNI